MAFERAKADRTVQQHHVVALAATGWPTSPGEIAALADAEHAAQAVDGEFRFRPIDEREPHRLPSRAKKAVAFFQDVPLLPKDLVLPPQPLQLRPDIALCCRGVDSAPISVPADPADQRRQPDPKITGDLALRATAGLRQADRFLLKFLRKPSLLCHRVPHPSLGTLHFPEASPDHRCRHVLPGHWTPEVIDPENPPPNSLLGRLLYGTFKGDPDAADKRKLLAEVAGSAAVGFGPRLRRPKAIVLLGELAEKR